MFAMEIRTRIEENFEFARHFGTSAVAQECFWICIGSENVSSTLVVVEERERVFYKSDPVEKGLILQVFFEG
jgi:hypothetical protein